MFSRAPSLAPAEPIKTKYAGIVCFSQDDEQATAERGMGSGQICPRPRRAGQFLPAAKVCHPVE